MSQCIFCKIINKEIPGHIIYEDEHVLAFLDISQSTKGHTLIIPKNHAKDIFSMTEDDMALIFTVVPKLAKALKETFNANGLNIVNNNGEAAGQTVFHYHVHLIPRYDETDGFTTSYTNNMSNYSVEQLATLKAQIMTHL